MKKVLPPPGQRVTCRNAVAIGYGERSYQWFLPGMVGVAAGIFPLVTQFQKGCRCQDWVLIDLIDNEGKIRQTGLDPHNIVIVKES